MARRKHLQGGILSMEKVREVLRLHEQGYKQRVISRATGVARSSLQALPCPFLHLKLSHE